MTIESVKRNNTWAWVDSNAVYITGKVLDVGCGYKPYKRLFPECEWVGLDIRPVGEVESDIELLDEDHFAAYDTVLCTDMLQYCLDPVVAMEQMVTALKPGGHLVVTADFLPDDGLYGFSPEALARLARGTKVLRAEQFGKAFTQLIDDFFSVAQAPIMPTDLKNVTGYADTRWPQISCLLAVKED